MKAKPYILTAAVLIMLLFAFRYMNVERKRETNILLLPSLPRPIAQEYALITSAGQGTDVYIVNDIANKLMIHNYFMPQARDTDLAGVKTIVFVVGCSSLGERLHGMSYDEEKKRISELLNKSKKEKLTVIAIYIGGKERRGEKSDELLQMIAQDTNYMIATRESNSDGFMSKLAKNNKIPLTLTNGVSDIAEPFASAFR